MRIDTKLFIGGPMDGKQYTPPPGHEKHGFIAFPVMVGLPSFSETVDFLVQPQVGKVEYRRETFIGKTQRFDVWVLDGLTIDDALMLLMANYRPEMAVTP